MKCVICGKKDVFLDYLCIDHYLEKNPIFKEIPKSIRINKCRQTGLFFKDNIQDKSIKSLLKKIIKREIKYDKKIFTLEKIKINIDKYKSNQIPNEKSTLEIELIGYINNMNITFPFTFPFEIRESLLPNIANKHVNYFEGTLQIRYNNRSKNEIKDILNFVKLYTKANKANIASFRTLKNGMDFLISDKRVVKDCAYEIKKRYGGEVKTSAKLFTRDKQTSKEVYRVTAIVRLPEFTVGDILKTDNKIILIKEIKNYEVLGTNILNHRRIMFDYQKNEFEIISKDNILRTTISKINPHLEALDPRDYQSKRIANPIKNLSLGQNIKVITVKDRFYIVKTRT